MSDFYRAFEDLHRGTRESIKDRLRIYLPFLKPWQEIDDKGVALDLGCGRGEWIELLSENNFESLGVDLDEGMLDEARAVGLKVKQQDALTALAGYESSTCCAISAFHVVEHIEFDDLRQLVQEAHRVLKPGGLLILETPNPANLVVSSNNFYIDPTHVRPIPLELLEFVVGYSGFERVKKMGLHGWTGSTEQIVLIDVLGGVAPDGAVVAQKNGDEDFLGQFDRAFRTPRGYSLGELAEKYDERQRATVLQLADQVRKIQSGMDQVFASRSWRWTQPFRDLWELAKKTKRKFLCVLEQSPIKSALKKILHRVATYVRSRPKLERVIRGVLRRLGILSLLKKEIGEPRKENSQPLSLAELEKLEKEFGAGVPEDSLVAYARVLTKLRGKATGEANENSL